MGALGGSTMEIAHKGRLQNSYLCVLYENFLNKQNAQMKMADVCVLIFKGCIVIKELYYIA